MLEEKNDPVVKSEPTAQNASEEGAAVATATAEDTPSLDALRALNNSKDETIKELTSKLISMQNQITKLVSGGAVITDGKHEEAPAVPETGQQEDYTPLSELDFAIGKTAD